MAVELYCLYPFLYAAFRIMQELQYIELFAGQANCWRAVSTEYPSARVDLDYFKVTPGSKEAKKQNPMDILSSAGLAFFGCRIKLLGPMIIFTKKVETIFIRFLNPIQQLNSSSISLS